MIQHIINTQAGDFTHQGSAQLRDQLQPKVMSVTCLSSRFRVVIAVDENVLSLSEPLKQSEELGDHFISLRKADGSVSGPWLVLPSETLSQVVLQDELDFTPYTGELQERTHISFLLARNGARWPESQLFGLTANWLKSAPLQKIWSYIPPTNNF